MPGTLLATVRGRPTLIIIPGGCLTSGTARPCSATYGYNAQGQRTRQVTAQGTTVYHYDLTGNLIGETTAGGQARRAYVYADTRPIAQIDVAGTVEDMTYLHTDHLNTPRIGTDTSGTVVWAWQSDAAGSFAPLEDPDGDGSLTTINLRYPGQYFDSETGLHYNWRRYYDPKIGRYITSDPIGLAGGLNTYAYVLNNPLRWTDPSGLFNPITHFGVGFDAARAAGYGVWDSLSIGWNTAAADWGTQAPYDAIVHAMTPPLRSPSDAKRDWQEFIDNNIAICTKESLGYALHAAQDAAASGHSNFAPYGGFSDLIINHPSHILSDWAPTQLSVGKAIAASNAVMQKAKTNNCSCAK